MTGMQKPRTGVAGLPKCVASADGCCGDTSLEQIATNCNLQAATGATLAAIVARLDGDDHVAAEGVEARSSSPVIALCRALLAAGHDPNRPLHVYRSTGIGQAAALECNAHGTGFIAARRERRAGSPATNSGTARPTAAPPQRAAACRLRAPGGSAMTLMNRPTDNLPAFHRSVVGLQCSGCGAERDAACTCGKPYVPVQQRVAEYDKANPRQSTRQAAADLDVHHSTVAEARGSGVGCPTPATVTGRDGKSYPARREPPEPEPPAPIPDTPVVRDHEADRALAHELIDIGHRALAAKFQSDKAVMARLKHVVEKMLAVWNVDWF